MVKILETRKDIVLGIPTPPRQTTETLQLKSSTEVFNTKLSKLSPSVIPI